METKKSSTPNSLHSSPARSPDKAGVVAWSLFGVDVSVKSSYSGDGPIVVPLSTVLSPYLVDPVPGTVGVATAWSTTHIKGKNVKKHCCGIEHGLVCRGGVDDTKLHIDLAPENNTFPM